MNVLSVRLLKHLMKLTSVLNDTRTTLDETDEYSLGKTRVASDKTDEWSQYNIG